MVLVNDEPVTAYQVEQRARLLALNANISEQAKENFQRLVKAESTNAQFRALQEEVIRNNQGKSREQFVAILQERQKQFGDVCKSRRSTGARAGILPQLRKEAKEELIDERSRCRKPRSSASRCTDDEVKRMVKDLAERNKMTYDQFAQHMKGMGVDIATLGERFSAQKAWRDLIVRRYGAQVSVTQRDVDRVLTSAASRRATIPSSCRCSKITLGLPSDGSGCTGEAL